MCQQTTNRQEKGLPQQTAASIVYTSHYLAALHYHTQYKNYKTINISADNSIMYVWPQSERIVASRQNNAMPFIVH